MGRRKTQTQIEPELVVNDQPVTTSYELNQSDSVVNTAIIDEPIEVETPEENAEETSVKKQRKPRQPRATIDKPATRTEKKLLAGQIEGAHKIAALVSGYRELELSSEESESLAGAIADLLIYHQIEIDPKKAAYLNLAVVVVSIYGPRGYMIYQRKKAEKQESSNKLRTPKTETTQQPEPIIFESTGEKEQAPPSAAFDIVEELAGGNFDFTMSDELFE